MLSIIFNNFYLSFLYYNYLDYLITTYLLYYLIIAYFWTTSSLISLFASYFYLFNILFYFVSNLFCIFNSSIIDGKDLNLHAYSSTYFNYLIVPAKFEICWWSSFTWFTNLQTSFFFLSIISSLLLTSSLFLTLNTLIYS